VERSWTETELAYFAGIIDGEGSFSLTQTRNSPNWCTSQLAVANTDPRLMAWIKTRFGGSIKDDLYRRNPRPRSKPMFRWVAAATDLATVVNAILPYLVLKREQAELFLAYRATVPSAGAKYAKISDSVLADRRLIRQKITDLNRRGKPQVAVGE
jgi:hypothetical protein